MQPQTRTTSSTGAASRPTGLPSDPKATVLAFYDAFDRGALGTFEAIDPRFAARVFGTTALDWRGFAAFAQAFREGFPDGRHEFDVVVAEGEWVATIGRYRGRHDRPFNGVPATGREVAFVVMHVDRVRDGRIVEHQGIGDINAMWVQLGVTPPAGNGERSAP